MTIGGAKTPSIDHAEKVPVGNLDFDRNAGLSHLTWQHFAGRVSNQHMVAAQ